MSLEVDTAQRSSTSDPRTYTLAITIEYSITTANAATQVTLDPANFSVVDQDSQVTYPAEAAGGAADCCADDIVTKSGPAVSCILHFLMPASVGGPSTSGGGVHAELQFNSLGLRGSDLWGTF